MNQAKNDYKGLFVVLSVGLLIIVAISFFVQSDGASNLITGEAKRGGGGSPGGGGGTTTQCNDKIDNDGDGYCDYWTKKGKCLDGSIVGDSDCSSSSDNTEDGVCVPSVEICDNLDNDCDGSVDEDLTRTTTCGVGACSGNQGYETCAAGSWGANTCNPYAGSSNEVCDLTDNDCDSIIDENLLVTCIEASTCGADGWVLSVPAWCGGDGNIWKVWNSHSCSNSGTCLSSCSQSQANQIFNVCTNGCSPITNTCNSANSCFDSDGGMSLLVAGSTSGSLSGTPYTNYDTCASGDTVTEYFCLGDSSFPSSQSCGSSKWGHFYCQGSNKMQNRTDYTCSTGACRPSNVPFLIESCTHGCLNGHCNLENSCFDSDGGINLATYGTASGILNGGPYSFSDYCYGSPPILVEHYCVGDTRATVDQSCGTDTYSANYCLGSSVYRNVTDYSCLNGVCAINNITEQVQSCANGCSNGVCVATPLPNSCTKTNGNYDPMIQGTRTLTINGISNITSDICVDSQNVKEFYCIGINGSEATVNCGIDAYYGGPICDVDGHIHREYRDNYCSVGACSAFTTYPIIQNCGTYGCNSQNNSCNGPAPTVFVGRPFCIGNNVHQYENNPSGSNKYYTKLRQNCTSGCSNGICNGQQSLSQCGNGVCDNQETKWTCPTDCSEAAGTTCGNSICESGESVNCRIDCFPWGNNGNYWDTDGGYDFFEKGSFGGVDTTTVSDACFTATSYSIYRDFPNPGSFHDYSIVDCTKENNRLYGIGFLTGSCSPFITTQVTSCVAENCFLRETAPISNDTGYAISFVNCPNGCNDGACY